jgi:hypothetical protein
VRRRHLLLAFKCPEVADIYLKARCGAPLSSLAAAKRARSRVKVLESKVFETTKHETYRHGKGMLLIKNVTCNYKSLKPDPLTNIADLYPYRSLTKMTKISAIEVLTQLQQYSNITDQANAELKACFWQLTKSKRKSHSRGILTNLESNYSASDLREEFNAVVGVESSEPALQDETDKKNLSQTTSWRLVDVRDEKPPPTTDTSESTGLRQRKKIPSKSSKVMSNIMEEEKEILDPLSLFGGLTPKEFKLAQQKATKALQHYIEAANAVATILEHFDGADQKR